MHEEVCASCKEQLAAAQLKAVAPKTCCKLELPGDLFFG